MTRTTMNPFLSIIIPTLNEEAFLPKLLDSLADQTYQDFEVIVADGCSEDGTVKVARRYMKKLPLAVAQAPHANVSLQRNLGATKARGRYLVFFDADSTIPAMYLEGIAEYLEAEESKLLTTFMRSPDGDMRKLIILTIANVGISVANFMNKPFAAGYNIVVDRNLFFSVNGFNPELKLSEDHDFVRRCHAYGERLTILPRLGPVLSFRRFEQYGFWQTVGMYTRASVTAILRGPAHDPHVHYPMGGRVYGKTDTLYFDD